MDTPVEIRVTQDWYDRCKKACDDEGYPFHVPGFPGVPVVVDDEVMGGVLFLWDCPVGDGLDQYRGLMQIILNRSR